MRGESPPVHQRGSHISLTTLFEKGRGQKPQCTPLFILGIWVFAGGVCRRWGRCSQMRTQRGGAKGKTKLK